MKTHANNPPNSGCISIFMLLFLCLSFSCSNEDMQENLSGKEANEITLKMSVDEANAIKIKKTGNFAIPESEAIEMVRQRYMKGALTKSGDNYIIKSCKKVSLPTMQTKSSTDEVPGYYVVEFISEGKEGFSMVSADRRIEEVFAFSEYGSLNDTVYNEGLKIFCEGLVYYIEDKIENFNTDSLYNAVSARLTSTKSGWIDEGSIHYLYMQQGFIPDPDYMYMGEETIGDLGTEYGTILTTQWKQTYPYNNKLPYVNATQRAYAGCTLIALVQIMGYHKINYKNITTTDWSRFTQTSQSYEEKLQDCIKSIFDEIQNKDVDANGTGISHKNANQFLNNNGYQTSYFSSYKPEQMVLPVMVSGYNPNSGHTWVIDCRRQSSSKTYDKYEKDDGYDIWRIYVEKREESGPLSVHCNWGWGGLSDGWYTSGSFYKSNSFDYRNNLEMTNIQPKN